MPFFKLVALLVLYSSCLSCADLSIASPFFFGGGKSTKHKQKKKSQSCVVCFLTLDVNITVTYPLLTVRPCRTGIRGIRGCRHTCHVAEHLWTSRAGINTRHNRRCWLAVGWLCRSCVARFNQRIGYNGCGKLYAFSPIAKECNLTGRGRREL